MPNQKREKEECFKDANLTNMSTEEEQYGVVETRDLFIESSLHKANFVNHAAIEI